MTYIHEKQGWPNLYWDSERLSPMLSATRYKEGELLGQMKALGFKLRTEASLNTLTADVVKSSAIEGENLNPAEVRSSIARRLGIETGGLVPAGHHVDGVVEMMLDATQHYEQALTDDRLFGWHAALFPTGRSGLRAIQVGVYRTAAADPMEVVSGPMGKEKVHFVAPKGERVGTEMTLFLNWFNNNQTTDPVLKAALAHLWFVTIHPFEDGNGRIARAIADMSLARADASKERFYSMSSQIEREKNLYYERLEKSQRGDLDITEWMTWFLDCLDRAIDSANDTLTFVFYKAKLWGKANQQPVNERQQLIINRMLDDFKGHMNTSKYARIAKCSPDTALRDIQELVSRNILIKNPGGGRSTSYRLASSDEI